MKIKVSILSQLFGHTAKSVSNWKKEKRPVVQLVHKYFSNEDIEEFLTTEKIQRLEKRKVDEHSKGKIIQPLNITKETNEAITAYQIVKMGDKTFQFNCSLTRSSCVGFNRDLCVSLLTNDGFVNMVDNRFLGIPENWSTIYTSNSEAQRKEKLKDCFAGFLKYLDEIYES